MLAAIGGVALKNWYHAPEFFWRARQAYLQARDDPLCLRVELFPHQGLYFSLSVWHDAEAMLTFAQSGPHRRVVQAASRLAEVHEFHHFNCIAVPSRDQALRVWSQHVHAAE